MVTEEGFIRRWSQRKLAAQAEPAAPQPVAAAGAAQPAEKSQAQDIHPEPCDADMPPLDSLRADSDYSPFLSPGVSDELRNLALRKLFQLPQFNIRDGLNDYDEDFSQIKLLGDAVAGQIRQRLEHQAEQLQQRRCDNSITSTEAIDTEDDTPVPESRHLCRDAEPGTTDPRPGPDRDGTATL